MFRLFLIQLLLFVCTSVSAQNSPMMIKLGDARTKKSLVAFPPLQYLGAPAAATGYQTVGAEIFNVIMNDLTVSSFFQFLPQSAFIENTAKTSLKPYPGDPNGFRFQSWSTLDVDFLIRGAFSIAGDDLNLEIYVYHVPKANLVLGKKYTAKRGSARRVAHTFANDVLEALSGTEGPFLSRIVTTSDRAGGGWREVYLMDWDGANVEKITEHRTIATSPAWSSDGSKIAYTAAVKRGRKAPRNHDMFLYDLRTGSSKLLSYRAGMNSGATFDRDSNHIYLTISNGTSPDIYKMDFSGKLVLQLTKGPNGAMNVEPNAGPNGKIAFSSDRSGRTMIFSMDSEGGSIKRLTHAGEFNSSPSWSPDGKKIAFAGQENNAFDIFVMNADGTGMIRLTKATKPNGRPANNEDPSFSPDGRYVMYTSNRTGKNQIYISTVDGAEERRVTNDNFNYYKPRWSSNLK